MPELCCFDRSIETYSSPNLSVASSMITSNFAMIWLCRQPLTRINHWLASQSTLCRFEQQANRQQAVAMHEVLIDQFIASYKRPPKRIKLDFDATDDPVHGTQIGRYFSGYYDHYCFLPLYVFCGQTLKSCSVATVVFTVRD